MSRLETTPGELAEIHGKLTTLRNELMTHVDTGVKRAGFLRPEERTLAVILLLLGAAQRYALQTPAMYEVFRAGAQDFANSEYFAVLGRSMSDMGPEFWSGGIQMGGNA